MSGMSGADIPLLRELAGKFDTQAGQLQDLISVLQAATTGSTDYWKGGKADQFRSEWDSLKPTFDKFVQTLTDAGQATKINADNIERATY
ncbi:WXG100 family type VII secretion target [Streptomyces sp. T028]|uniref:WXG100 family type VII secretion target n=1 Tax=Streptomyces sp. T028 TaxID=3394379 RepID=UPI003A84ADB4